MRKLRYLDFFAGIGGFHSAFERVGWECVGFCEIDKFARQSYKAIHNVEGAKEWHDITAVTDEEFATLRGQVDVIAGGFPCQAFSVAGKRGGFEDSRGTLFFEVARAAKAIKPKYLVLENVKGLLSHDKGNTVDVILRTLNELGYTVDFEILNTKFFGVPQNRERIFIVAVRDDLVTQEAWNIAGNGVVAKAKKRFSGAAGVKSFNFFGWASAYDVVGAKLRDVLETEVDAKYYLSEERTANLIEKSADNPNITQVVADLNHYSQESLNRIYGVDGQAPTINTMQGGGREPKIAEPSIHATLTPDRAEKRQNGRRFKDNDEPMFTLTAQDKHGITEVQSNEQKKTDTVEILRKLWQEVGAEAFEEWAIRSVVSLQSEEILRQNVHEETSGDEKQFEFDRKQQQNECTSENQIYDRNQRLPKMRVNEESGCSSQGSESIQQFARELAGIVQGLPHQGTQIEKLCDLWEETQGIGLLRKALSEIQKIWRSELYEKPRYRIRKLTVLECWRLQNFTDEQFYKAKAAGVSDSQLYKQAGNSVTVKVVDVIAHNLAALDASLR